MKPDKNQQKSQMGIKDVSFLGLVFLFRVGRKYRATFVFFHFRENGNPGLSL
jgi:hypothetical protein